MHTRALVQPGLCPTVQQKEGDLPLAWFSPRCWCKQQAGRGGINHSGVADEQGQCRNAATCPRLFWTSSQGRRVGTSSLSLHGALSLFGQSKEMWVFYLQVTCLCWGQASVSHIPNSLRQLIYSKPIAMGFSQGLGARVGVVPVLLVLYCDSLVPSFWLFQCFAVWSLFPSFLPAFPLGSSGAARCQPGRLLHGSARTESRRRQGWAAASLGVPCTSVTSATCSSRASPMGGNPLPAPGMAAVLREGVMLPAQRFHRAQRGNLSGSL